MKHRLIDLLLQLSFSLASVVFYVWECSKFSQCVSESVRNRRKADVLSDNHLVLRTSSRKLATNASHNAQDKIKVAKLHNTTIATINNWLAVVSPSSNKQWSSGHTDNLANGNRHTRHQGKIKQWRWFSMALLRKRQQRS